MDVSSILQQFESVSHSDRMKILVKLGKESTTNRTTNKLIQELSQRATYEKLLALETCYGSQDASLALQILSSPSKHLKKRCISMLGLFGTDDEFFQGLQRLPAGLQLRSIQRLKNLKPKRRRLAVIDRFVERLEDDSTGNGPLRMFLAYGTKELVDKYLPTTVESFTARDWACLATYHPEIVLRELKSWRKRISGPLEEPFHKTITRTITQWSSSAWTVDLALKLLDVVLPDASLKHYPTKSLIRRRPRQIADILLKQEDKDISELMYNITVDNKQLQRLINCLSTDELWRITELYPSLANVTRYFRLFSPAFRSLIYEKYLKESRRDEDGIFDIVILRLLPTEERTKEARRHMTLSVYETKPSDRIGHISMLPWNEAMSLQQEYLSSTDAHVRERALRWQIRAAKYDSNHLGDALQIIIKHENEREHIRLQMMHTLMEVPVSRFKKQYLPALQLIVTQCLNAEGAKPWSYQPFSIFITKLLSYHPEWAAEQYLRLYKDYPIQASVGDLVGTVSERKFIMSIVSEKLSPLIEARLENNSGDTKIANLAKHFHKHIRYWPSFLDTIEKICERGFLLDHLHPILKKERPKFWAKNMGAILARGSFVEEIREQALEYVTIHAQQHLKVYFGYDTDPPINAYDREKLLCRFDKGFWRWTKAQQDTYAEILQKDISDPEATSKDKLKALKRLRKLPFIDTKISINYALLKESSTLRTVALRALRDLDTDDGIPTLLEVLNDERGSVAIFLLEKTFQAMPKQDAFRILKAVPSIKVTVAKEVVRLVGELKTEEAFQHLVALESSGVHDDVRIVIFTALWNYLERTETWEIYTRAAESDVVKIAKAVVNIPIANKSPEIQEKILHLLHKLLQHSSAEVRTESLSRLDTLPYIPVSDLDVLAPRIQELISSPSKSESILAITTFLTRYSIPHPELTSSIFHQNLPNMKLVHRMVNIYIRLVRPDPPARIACTKALIKVLSNDDATMFFRLPLIFVGLPIPSHPDAIMPLLPIIHYELLANALEHIAILCGRAETPKLRQELLECELKFKESKDEKGRRLAFQYLMLARGKTEYGTDIRGFEKPWNEDQRARLDEYRKDESFWIRELAMWVYHFEPTYQEAL